MPEIWLLVAPSWKGLQKVIEVRKFLNTLETFHGKNESPLVKQKKYFLLETFARLALHYIKTTLGAYLFLMDCNEIFQKITFYKDKSVSGAGFLCSVI